MDVKGEPIMKRLVEYIEDIDNVPQVGDNVDIELNEDECILSTHIVEILEDGVVVECSESFADEFESMLQEQLDEAEYQGRKVPLGKPMKGDVKKSKVYVRKPNGKVVKVNFGDKNMRIKKNIPGRRKNFRARHHCSNPGPRWKARYWSCRAW